ncbi:MAG: hypothetical protein ACRCW5_11010 [Cetobacterium sp.]|uniref:hypothetical protein n=1 Tax=Cetobacterium sp. TaxID=2071632 RepID=UPI003F3E4146
MGVDFSKVLDEGKRRVGIRFDNDLVAKSGIAPSVVNMMRKVGNPAWKNVVKLAAFFGVPVSEMISWGE